MYRPLSRIARLMAALAAVATCAGVTAQDQNVEVLRANAADFSDRFGLNDLDHFAVDDRGKGLAELQGLRNFRSVLPGILYRAGGNNAYRVPKLPNNSPLPPEALPNLCKQGFSEAVYLYGNGFKAQTATCDYQGRQHETVYAQQPINGSAANGTHLLRIIREQIVSLTPHPVLVHCYNGYHESGYASAIALRQFCGFSSAQAYRYWEKNAAPGVSFATMKKRIERFTPAPDLAISKAQSAAICPASAN